MRTIAERRGLAHLVAPVRPSWKERYPLTPIERYVTWLFGLFRGDLGISYTYKIPVSDLVGVRIWISLPGLESIAGQVRWVEDWTVGVKFDHPLYPSVFDLVHEF